MRWVGILVLAVGCSNPCDKAAEYLRTECALVNTEDPETCKRGEIERCEAECVLAADCEVFVPPTDFSGDAFSTYLQTVKVFDDCVAACQPVTDSGTEPEDTALF